jgi:hypothetical protein
VVVTPSVLDFAMTLLDDAKDLRDFTLGDAMILRHFDAWLKPHLELTIGCFDVDVHTFLFQGEEIETVLPLAEDGGTHGRIVTLRRAPSSAPGSSRAATLSDSGHS